MNWVRDTTPKRNLLKSNQELFDLYKSRREMGRNFLDKGLLSNLPKDALLTCGKSLEILKGKTLILNKQEELDIIFDYCLFHHYSGSKNAIDRFILSKFDILTEDEKIYILAAQKAEFSIFGVEKTISHGGVIVMDLLRGKKELLIDKGLSLSGLPGVVMASTVLHFPEFIMTSGAALPLNHVIADVVVPIEEYLEKRHKSGSLSKKENGAFATKILKICFRESVSDNIAYRDINAA